MVKKDKKICRYYNEIKVETSATIKAYAWDIDGIIRTSFITARDENPTGAFDFKVGNFTVLADVEEIEKRTGYEEGMEYESIDYIIIIKDIKKGANN